MSTKVLKVQNRIGAEREIGREVLETLLDGTCPADPSVGGVTSFNPRYSEVTKHLKVLFPGVGEVTVVLGSQRDGGWKGGITVKTTWPEGIYIGHIETVKGAEEFLVTIDTDKVDL